MGEVQVQQAQRVGVTDRRVLEALRAVDRQLFVPEGADPGPDAPIPIGGGQTTSQPSLIARTLQELQLTGHERVLDVGAGSGYQTALLAHLAAEVIGLEVRPELAAAARERLAALRLANARVVVGDGWTGLPEEAPFDAITVGAQASDVPSALVDQLRVGGRMIVPVGPGATADLLLLTRREDGTTTRRRLMAVRFVPLIRGGAADAEL